MRYFLVLFLLLLGCKSNDDSVYTGEFFLYYVDGKILAENDLSRQVYVFLKRDNTYKVKYRNRTQIGRWNTVDCGDFTRVFFYDDFSDYLFDRNRVVEAQVAKPMSEAASRIIYRTRGYNNSLLSEYAKRRIIFCERHKVLSKNELKFLLKWN